MSVIDQALKKTQSALHEQTHAIAVDDEPVKKPAAKKTTKRSPSKPNVNAKKKSWAMIVSIVIGATIFSTIALENFPRIAGFYNSFLHTSTLKSIALPHQPIAVSSPSSPMILNGTVRADNERVALINHHLYYKGEMINGYQITDIQYSHVILFDPITRETRVLTPQYSP